MGPGFLDHLWPTVERAMDWVLSLRRADGVALWAIEADGTRPWDYALLTGSSSIHHALRCATSIADIVAEPRPDWLAAADVMAAAVVDRPDAFEPKSRWAMDWYYPVLTGALTGEAAKTRLAEGWDLFAMEGRGIRCVSRRAVGDGVGDGRVRRWRSRRSVTVPRPRTCWRGPASTGDPTAPYWTGLVHDGRRIPARFPFEEHTSYTAAAVILAADAIAGASPASGVFTPLLPDDD